MFVTVLAVHWDPICQKHVASIAIMQIKSECSTRKPSNLPSDMNLHTTK